MHGHLNWFGTPLHGGEHAHGASHEKPQQESTQSDSNSNDYSPVKLTTTDTQNVPFEHEDGMHETPAFHRHAEATTAELFYDLFFVANLTTFTANLEINDSKALSAYIGFFCLLWFTWYQTSLYDVRFAADSVFERCCKALHFGVMVGFAVIGPDWKPGQAVYSYQKFKAFSYILMVSRFVLIGQYGVTLFFTWRYRRTRLPLLMVMTSYLVAAILYGALSTAFPKDSETPTTSNVYIAWYVIAVGETLLTTAVSCYWRVISFKGTHLIQRMSLLTLIILGEGIIVICKAISYIVKNEYPFDSSVTGQIVSSILIIYFLYMLYFDRLREDHFGTIKQQIWAFIHFPLHISLVLLLEGVSNFVTWRQAIVGTGFLDSWMNGGFQNFFIDHPVDFNNVTLAIDYFNSTAIEQVFAFVPKGTDLTGPKQTVEKALEGMDKSFTANMTAAEALKDDDFLTNYANYYFTLFNTNLNALGIKAPEKKEKDGAKPDPSNQLLALFEVFDLIFVYFFVTAGLTLIVMGTLAVLSEKPKTIGAYFRSGMYFAVGLALCFLSLMKFTDAEVNYASSSWVLPTLVLSFFAVVVINYIRRKPKAHNH